MSAFSGHANRGAKTTEDADGPSRQSSLDRFAADDGRGVRSFGEDAATAVKICNWKSAAPSSGSSTIARIFGAGGPLGLGTGVRGPHPVAAMPDLPPHGRRPPAFLHRRKACPGGGQPPAAACPGKGRSGAALDADHRPFGQRVPRRRHAVSACLQGDLLKALAVLDRMSESLETYVSTPPPESSAALRTSPSATAARDEAAPPPGPTETTP